MVTDPRTGTRRRGEMMDTKTQRRDTMYDAPPTDKLIIRQGEAAEACGVTTRTIRNWHNRGLIKRVRIGNVTGYRPDDLTALIAAGVR